MCIDPAAERPLSRGQDEKRERDAQLAELAQRYRSSVGRLCEALLADPAEAEDATQQTFLLAYESLLSGVRPQRPRAWLYAIARRECWARQRRRRRERAVPQEGARAGPDPSDQAVLRAELASLVAGVGRLPARQKQALVLHELAGLSQRQLAVALGSSESAVEALLARARRTLRRGRFVLAPLSFPLSLPRSPQRILHLAYHTARSWASIDVHGAAEAAATTLTPLAAATVVALAGTPTDRATRAEAAQPAKIVRETAPATVTRRRPDPRPTPTQRPRRNTAAARASRRQPSDVTAPLATAAAHTSPGRLGGAPGRRPPADPTTGTPAATPPAPTPTPPRTETPGKAAAAREPSRKRETHRVRRDPPRASHPGHRPAPPTKPAGTTEKPPTSHPVNGIRAHQADRTAAGPVTEKPTRPAAENADTRTGTDPRTRGRSGARGTVDGVTPGPDPAPPPPASRPTGSTRPGDAAPPASGPAVGDRVASDVSHRR